MNASGMIKLLKKECKKAGCQQRWAKKNGLSQGYISDVLNQRKEIGQSIAKALGYEQVILYKKLRT